MKVPLAADNRVLKTVIKAGYGVSPIRGQEVILNYAIKKHDGTVLDDSKKRRCPWKFLLGAQQVENIIEKAVYSMQRGEKAQFDIPIECSPVKNAAIIAKIELVDFASKKKPVADMIFEEKVKFAEELKVKGNDFFKAKLLKEASESYKEGVIYLDSALEEEEKQAEILPIWISLNLNLCLCLNSFGSWSESKKHSDKVLQKIDDNLKARYLRGLAEKNMALFEEALSDFKYVLDKTPEDERIKYEIENTKEKKKQAETKAKKALGKLFTSANLYSEKKSMTLKVPRYDPTNPKVYLDLQIGKDPTPRKLIIELFSKYLPITTENFKCLCTGEKSTGAQKLFYKGCRFFKLVKGFMLEGGDIENNDGTGGQSIYGGKFSDEGTWFEHSEAGLLSMSNSGPNKNDSKFFILLGPGDWLNKKNTVFGRIIKGVGVLLDIAKVPISSKDVPEEPITIVDCGIHNETSDE